MQELGTELRSSAKAVHAHFSVLVVMFLYYKAILTQSFFFLQKAALIPVFLFVHVQHRKSPNFMICIILSTVIVEVEALHMQNLLNGAKC